MISVRINGEESTISSQGTPRLGDLIELIKASIDPDHMITAVTIDGRDLEEHEWQAGTGQFGTAVLEIETGTPESYVNERLGRAASIVGACYAQFRTSRKFFQSGDMATGNKHLVDAVDALRAFFEWFATLTQLLSPERQEQFDINPQVELIMECCKKICQQQLYQSWWALGESLEKDLEPNLDKLEDFLRGAAKQIT